MTNQITRRTILAAAPALACGPSVSMAAPHDPLPAWFEEWKKLQHGVDNEDLEYEDCAATLLDLEEKICTTPPATRLGAIAQLEYAMDDFGDYLFGNIWKDHDRKLFANLLTGLKAGV
ncbi:hypothetical protein JQX09_15675 [Sulfitobacter pseudonitzschiae]|uniref:Twin-arginine translocation pathway signal n=1 Tax=Pseudosulfitobacter pseudonitzschiae TaxID=1402135 RepID=A0A9Q2RWH2_9RHOB|nr:hypothetical protein [Pseudosulfitobacter pseudonitzschiae]MBM2293469.1 hypothetical protein [Pseudosulfitobacter pseudonitzschiae]MBM2298283.1 hypothetical protein [Pseudosulfitobacter pseudonitzschiae]MBM2303196.1 hypothetical protein [Pseudosulfitobacter pseudonitzschiae]MBM2312980.1 hypothetical protein [Pseudosulfitobacter pseudonitzschiae]MBM2317893.1 hypothetical protein [Pseudosulfitobacter pseudonitzschiae]